MNSDDCMATVKIPGYDTVDVARRVEPITGHTRYRIDGHRVTGVVVLIPCYEPDYVDPDTTRILVQLGDCLPGHESWFDSERAYLPVCNSVELAGEVTIDLTLITPNHRVTPHSLGIGRILCASGEDSPEPARHRMASVIAAIADHWRSSPDNPAVRRTAAHHALATGDYLTNKETAIRDFGFEITELIAVLNRHHAEYDHMKQLIGDRYAEYGDGSVPVADAT